MWILMVCCLAPVCWNLWELRGPLSNGIFGPQSSAAAFQIAPSNQASLRFAHSPWPGLAPGPNSYPNCPRAPVPLGKSTPNCMAPARRQPKGERLRLAWQRHLLLGAWPCSRAGVGEVQGQTRKGQDPGGDWSPNSAWALLRLAGCEVDGLPQGPLSRV